MPRSAWAATPRRSSSASRTLHLVGLDRDTDALRIAGERLARFGDRITLVHTVYDGIADAVTSSGFAAADGILFDLGVSSLQLDVADRGFAYAQDAPLDMRMDQSAGTTAADILATYGEGDLRRIFERYGEEKLAGRYARAIIAARTQAPIERSGRLVEILQAATPAAVQRAGHPAKRVFQALRIEVNRELVGARARHSRGPGHPPGRRAHGRAVVPVPRGPPDQARASPRHPLPPRPRACPSSSPSMPPSSDCSSKVPSSPPNEERAVNPRATPVRLRAAERVRPEHAGGAS